MPQRQGFEKLETLLPLAARFYGSQHKINTKQRYPRLPAYNVTIGDVTGLFANLTEKLSWVVVKTFSFLHLKNIFIGCELYVRNYWTLVNGL